MGKRAATALRITAIGIALLAIRQLVIGLLRDGVLAELRGGSEAHAALFARLKLYSDISFWAHLTTATLVGVGIALLVASLGAGRRWALGALISMIVHVAVTIANRAIEWPDEIPFWAKLLWWINGAALAAAISLPLIAVHRARSTDLSRLAAIGGALLMVVDGAFSAYGLTLESYTPLMMWIERVLTLLIAAWFAGFAFPLASGLARGAGALTGSAAAGHAIDGTPLRALAWTLLARIGLGIGLQVAIMLSLMNGDYESAGSLTTLGTMLGVLLSVVILGALIAYLRFPAAYRGDSLIVTIVLLVAGVVLDLVAGNAASELFGMAGEAKRASSFWSMPSLSKMEELQSMVAWAGRGGLAIGIGAGFALAVSLRETARAVAETALVSKAQRLMTLLIIAGIGAVGVSLLVGGMRGDAAGLLIVLALVLLTLAVFVLVDWLALLFGLARAVERTESSGSSETLGSSSPTALR